MALIIGSVGILNFVNTILTSIFTRRRELATLQSVGMTGRQMMKMLHDSHRQGNAVYRLSYHDPSEYYGEIERRRITGQGYAGAERGYFRVCIKSEKW